MRRLILPVLLLLCLAAAPARAVMITGYAMGQVTQNRSSGPASYPFAVGEAVYLTYRYDLQDPLFPRVGVSIATAGGYSFQIPYGAGVGRDNVVVERPGGLAVRAADPASFATLNLVNDLGTLDFFHNGPNGFIQEGFLASMAAVPDATGFPVPEPSTAVLGAIGAGLVGIAGWRKRR